MLLRRTLFALGLVGLTAALFWPSVPAPETSLPLDKVAHLLMFAVVALLGRWSQVPLRWLVGLLASLALVSEVVQGAVLERRGGDVVDLAADLVGIGLGLLAARAAGAGSAGASLRRGG